MAAAERAAASGSTELTEAVARYLHKLMAYKDEYEVARLALDVFGLQRMRRIERELVDEYRESIKASLVLLNEENLAEVRRLAELPDAVRGYEGVKLAAIERYRAEQARILGELRENTRPVST